jgi:hypothetical protein
MYLWTKDGQGAVPLLKDPEYSPQYEDVPSGSEIGVENNIHPGKVDGKLYQRKKNSWNRLRLAIASLFTLCFLSLAYNGLASVLGLVSLLVIILSGNIQVLTDYQSQEKFKLCPNGTQGHTSFPRKVVIEKRSESIVGRYPIFDLLSLSTTSGSIGVTVIPQIADTQSPDEPARLRIRTGSGSIAVSFTFPGATFSPEIKSNQKPGLENKRWNELWPLQSRPYELDVETTSGSISGQFFFSTSARLSSKSGSISARLLPIVRLINSRNVDCKEEENFVANTALITTWTDSGSQNVHLMSPCFVPFSGETLKANSSVMGKPALSHHNTQRGTLNINYPSAWTGNAHARTESGNIAFGGNGLDVINNEDGSVDGFKYEGQREWRSINVSLGSEAGAIVFNVG